MKTTTAIAKGLILGAALIAIAALTGCTTITTTAPDGTVTTVRSTDSAAVMAYGNLAVQAATLAVDSRSGK